MKRLLVVLWSLLSISVYANGNVESANATTVDNQCAAFLDHDVRKLHSKEQVNLCELTKDKAILVVNTASNCGFTPQFKALEAIHKEYKDQGLVVIGFPSDDFFQEEDEEKETAKVCFVNYGVTFTMLQTSAVRGSDVNPVFKHLGEETTSPKWNFYKYIVSKDRQQVKHFNSRVDPNDKEFISAIEAVL